MERLTDEQLERFYAEALRVKKAGGVRWFAWLDHIIAALEELRALRPQEEERE